MKFSFIIIIVNAILWSIYVFQKIKKIKKLFYISAVRNLYIFETKIRKICILFLLRIKVRKKKTRWIIIGLDGGWRAKLAEGCVPLVLKIMFSLWVWIEQKSNELKNGYIFLLIASHQSKFYIITRPIFKIPRAQR